MGVLATSIYSLALPAVLFEITESGIMVYASPSTTVNRASESIAEDLFIPWERIEAIYFLTRRQVLALGLGRMSESRGPEGGNPLVVLRIRRGFRWPPASSLRRPSRWTKNARPDEIYLNAYYGTLRGMRLYRTMEELRARYAAPRLGDR